MEPQSDIPVTMLPDNTKTVVSPMNTALHNIQETVGHKVEDNKPASFTDNKNISSFNSVPDNVQQHPTRNDPAPLGRSKPNEEPFSPDGFTQFEKVLI